MSSAHRSMLYRKRYLCFARFEREEKNYRFCTCAADVTADCAFRGLQTHAMWPSPVRRAVLPGAIADLHVANGGQA